MNACRARLYRLSRQDISGETPVPTAEWKESCKKAIIPDVSIALSKVVFEYDLFYRTFQLHTVMPSFTRHHCQKMFGLWLRK